MPLIQLTVIFSVSRCTWTRDRFSPAPLKPPPEASSSTAAVTANHPFRYFHVHGLLHLLRNGVFRGWFTKDVFSSISPFLHADVRNIWLVWRWVYLCMCFGCLWVYTVKGVLGVGGGGCVFRLFRAFPNNVAQLINSDVLSYYTRSWNRESGGDGSMGVAELMWRRWRCLGVRGSLYRCFRQGLN